MPRQSDAADRDDFAFAEVAPRLEAFLDRPRRIKDIKQWGQAADLGVIFVLDLICWLEMRGRIRGFAGADGGKRFVVAREG